MQAFTTASGDSMQDFLFYKLKEGRLHLVLEPEFPRAGHELLTALVFCLAKDRIALSDQQVWMAL